MDTAPGAGIWLAPALHRNPEAASWELIHVARKCDDIREVHDRSYPLHLSSDRGFCSEVDVRGRHERCCTRGFGRSMT
jgi:hypothetical protein